MKISNNIDMFEFKKYPQNFFSFERRYFIVVNMELGACEISVQAIQLFFAKFMLF